MIETVVFDLGGVLVDWNPRYLFSKVFSDHDEMEIFLTTVVTQDWNERQDAGRPISVAIEEIVAKHPKYESHVRIYFDRWSEMLKGPMPGTADVLREIKLHGRHRLLALSNWSAETFHHARAKFPELQFFESILVSGDEKLIKPDPKFFRLLESRHGVVPSRAIFIDDVEKNVRAARELGYHVHHFKNAGDLRADLVERGILPR